MRLERFNSDASIPTLNRNILNTLSMSIPKLKEQIHIASILSAYGNLIENNRRRIQLLEEAAHHPYKEWFIHLRFPGDENSKITNGAPKG